MHVYRRFNLSVTDVAARFSVHQTLGLFFQDEEGDSDLKQDVSEQSREKTWQKTVITVPLVKMTFLCNGLC